MAATQQLDIKAQLKQRIQEKILAKTQPPKPQYSIGGFFSNVKSDVGEIVNGIGALLGMGGKAIMHPIETVDFVKSGKALEAMKMMGAETIKEYKEYKDPLKKMYEDPLQVITDALTIATLGGGALTKLGQVAKVAPLVKAGEAVSYVGKPLTVSKDLAKFGISKIPGGTEFLTALEQRSQAISLVSKTQQAHLIERNKLLGEVDKTLKTLTKEEQATLIPYAEGTIEVVNPSVNFQKAVDLTKKLATQREEVIKQAGKLKPELIEARKWQPIMKATGLESIDEIKQTFGITKDPIYVQHIFDDKPKKFTDFFINNAPVKNWKPGFLKKSYGVPGYSIDANNVLKWEAAQTLKFKNNINLLEKVKGLDSVEPLDNLKNLKPGYKVFAPDGYIRFYQGTIDLVSEFTKGLRAKGALKDVGDIWDNLKDAIDGSLIEKKYTGITSKVKLYQVPESVAGVLQGYAKTTNPYIKLFIDKPVDAFRFLALALTPRWLVNNVVGNTIFSIIAGDPLSPAGYLTARKAQELGLVPDDVFSGFYRTEKLMTGNLGRAAETKLGKIISGVGEKVSEAPIIKQIGKLGDLSYKINSVVDDWYRTSHYVNQATKLAKQKILQTTGQKLNNSIKLLEYAKQDPEITAKAIKSVDDFFYSASKLSPFERQVARRFLPFYSWYKFIATYSARLPLEYPGRFNAIRNLAQGFYQLTGQNQLPEYLKGSVPIGETKTGDTYYLRTSGMNPFGLLEDLATIGVEQTALSSLTPPAKTLVERLTARESFTGKTYTAKDIIETYNGQLYKYNQITGKIEEVTEKTKPALLEHLLRNFIPQYQLIEQAIAGGSQQYTAAGLPSLITGEGIKKSSLTKEPITKVGAGQKVKLRALGLLGIPVSLKTTEQQQLEKESLQKATSQYFYQQFPTLSPQFKSKLKEELKNKILLELETRGSAEGIW